MRDSDRFADIYQQYYRAIVAKCRRLLQNEEAALDVAQDVFVRAHRHWDKFRYGESPLPWLYTIANNLCVNQLRRQRVRQVHARALSEAELQGSDLDLLRQIEAKQLVGELLRRSNPQSASIAIAYYVDELEIQAIAELMGLSRKTVSKRLQRFLNDMRKVVKRL